MALVSELYFYGIDGTYGSIRHCMSRGKTIALYYTAFWALHIHMVLTKVLKDD